MKEIWKDIEGYEGLYQVSNYGRIYSLERTDSCGRKRGGCIRAPQQLPTGYYIVALFKNGVSKIFLLHRLVASHFLPNPSRLPVVNHKDRNPANNSVDNLEWCTQSYNVLYEDAAKRAAITRYKAIAQYTVDGVFVKHWPSITEAAQYFNKDTAHIVSCCKGKRKTAYGYVWRYASLVC